MASHKKVKLNSVKKSFIFFFWSIWYFSRKNKHYMPYPCRKQVKVLKYIQMLKILKQHFGHPLTIRLIGLIANVQPLIRCREWNIYLVWDWVNWFAWRQISDQFAVRILSTYSCEEIIQLATNPLMPDQCTTEWMQQTV